MQNATQNRMKPVIDKAITDLCSNTNTLLHGKMMIVDVGCSSGPNAVALILTATDAIHGHCLQSSDKPTTTRSVCVLLNDLPDNDINMVVKSGHAPSKQEDYCCDWCRAGVILRATVH